MERVVKYTLSSSAKIPCRQAGTGKLGSAVIWIRFEEYTES